ncbi:hypothetical protein [Streptomyces chartreusis]|nr:hypothetical protein OG938_31720 [Streptomyces chartreusis]
MPEQPETTGQRMSRLIREAPVRRTRQLMLDAIQRSNAARKNGESK